jgi:hypothetical protein
MYWTPEKEPAFSGLKSTVESNTFQDECMGKACLLAKLFDEELTVYGLTLFVQEYLSITNLPT